MTMKQGLITYPIPSDFTWECPKCKMKHSGPHYAHEGQIDFDKKPSEVGRIKFNRRLKDDSLDADTLIVSGLSDEANPIDASGFQKPLFCPHCGWVDDWITIKRIGETAVSGKVLEGIGVDKFLTDLPKGNYTRKELLERFWKWLRGAKE